MSMVPNMYTAKMKEVLGVQPLSPVFKRKYDRGKLVF